MNIFVLDYTPEYSARALCDKHLGKMLIESAQLLCQCFEPGEAPYRRTHVNHPCSIWVRADHAHFDWLVSHAQAIFGEWTKQSSVAHKSIKVVEWCAANKSRLSFARSSDRVYEFVQCVPAHYQRSDLGLDSTVLAYRDYYKNEKTFAQWKPPRQRPAWFERGEVLREIAI